MSHPRHPLATSVHSPPKTPTSTNFVVLIGGPGIAVPCDHEHDQTWKNYIVPIQTACSKHQITFLPGEKLQWWVYGPAYSERWTDDLSASGKLKVRQKAIQEVKDKEATDYLDRIRQIAGACGAALTVLNKPEEFWSGLNALPDNSLSRVWYIGHAYPGGLMLKLQHSSETAGCRPQADPSDIVPVEDISKYSSLLHKKLVHKGPSSKFVGCMTDSFAKQWNTLLHAPAEGAVSRIDFGATDRPSKINDIIPRLQKSRPDTNWTTYSK